MEAMALGPGFVLMENLQVNEQPRLQRDQTDYFVKDLTTPGAMPSRVLDVCQSAAVELWLRALCKTKVIPLKTAACTASVQQLPGAQHSCFASLQQSCYFPRVNASEL